MINIICLITVTIAIPNGKIPVLWMQQEQVHGKILQDDNESYLVDFSKEATEKGYVGDYHDRMVAKSMCMRIK
jgi:hypothetical protein